MYKFAFSILFLSNRYLVTYLLIILSTLIDKQGQTQERRAIRGYHRMDFLLREVLATVKTKGKPSTSSYKEEITFNMEIHQR